MLVLVLVSLEGMEVRGGMGGLTCVPSCVDNSDAEAAAIMELGFARTFECRHFLEL